MLKETLARILRSDKPTPADEIRNAQRQIEQRQNEITQRLDDIAENHQFSGHPGPARKQALVEGDPTALVELDREHELLVAERKALAAQEAELSKRLEQAEKAEALQDLPALIKAHPARIQAYRKAVAAMQQAKRDFDEHVTAITVKRRAAGDHAPGITLEQAEEVADLRGQPESEKHLTYNGVRHQLCIDLSGQSNRQPDRTKTQMKAEANRTRFENEASDGDREPPKPSIWDKKEPGRAA